MVKQAREHSSMQISSRSPRSRSSNDNEAQNQENKSISQSNNPHDAYSSMMRNLENSSIPPSSVADKSEPYQDEEEDYKSMWADISEHTVGRNGSNLHESQNIIASTTKDEIDNPKGDAEEDYETENSSMFYNFHRPFCTSIKGQIDLNSSFPGSASAAS